MWGKKKKEESKKIIISFIYCYNVPDFFFERERARAKGVEKNKKEQKGQLKHYFQAQVKNISAKKKQSAIIYYCFTAMSHRNQLFVLICYS